ncbi:hypothetical protein RyT2_11680 [Pseudolactococcus yaeyamensis]
MAMMFDEVVEVMGMRKPVMYKLPDGGECDAIWLVRQLEERYEKVFVPKMVIDWDKTLAEAGEDGLTYAGYIDALLGVADEDDLFYGGLEYPEGYLEWIHGNGNAVDSTLNKIKVINGHVLGFTDVDPKQLKLF